ncbi:hypothetical protein ACFW16_28055 [Inquilinus sp. NPDC058860]|uniref:hypothetical protein n=1 Tax=Inquilinus sp. NPDC058860 TaxID=3346652 RepID=UPI0036905F8E
MEHGLGWPARRAEAVECGSSAAEELGQAIEHRLPSFVPDGGPINPADQIKKNRFNQNEGPKDAVIVRRRRAGGRS